MLEFFLPFFCFVGWGGGGTVLTHAQLDHGPVYGNQKAVVETMV